MIDGVILKPLKIIPNELGDIYHMFRCDDSLYSQFGEVYFSFINPGCVKGWKKHLKQTQFFAVPLGNARIVIYDDREESSTNKEVQIIDIGVEQYQLLRIPPQVWYSFSSLNQKEAMIVNCADIPHDPNESLKKDLSDSSIPYSWTE